MKEQKYLELIDGDGDLIIVKINSIMFAEARCLKKEHQYQITMKLDNESMLAICFNQYQDFYEAYKKIKSVFILE